MIKEIENKNENDPAVENLLVIRHGGNKRFYRKRKYIVLFLIVVLILGCAIAIMCHLPKHNNKTETESEPWINMRLSGDVIPMVYNLEIFIDMGDDNYSGNVTIDVITSQPTNWILLHVVQLDITRVSVRNNSQNIDVENIFIYNPNELCVIRTRETLQKHQRYAISLQYRGKMRNDLSGLYTSYFNDGEVIHKVASTFFSPISARSAFPCFDEPKYKANFTLTLTHSKQYHALSNMPAKSITYSDNLVTTSFYTSLKMSTYIVCWVVSNFSYIELKSPSNPVQRAWGPRNFTKNLQYGLDITGKLLKFYENYFNISYPLTKLDTFAIPNLGPGAMENWGLITYRSQIIMQSEKRSTDENRQQALNVISHELVHQWFGNLVTMKFWTDAWLKEGFANNIGILGADEIDKSLNIGQQVLTTLMLPALEEDAYSTSQPISSKARTPNEIREVFNIITYNKGSCIVEMLNQYLGAETFRKGLQQYLKFYSYSNANQDNLWEQLSNVSNKDVKSVMDTWTLQSGYPVVSVRRIDESIVEISQAHFTLDPHHIIPPPSPFGYKWKIPLIFQNPINKKRQKYLLEEEKVQINISEDFLLLNPDHSLFYRVRYHSKTLFSIKQLLMRNIHALSPQDRTGLISDQFNLVKYEAVNIESVLDLLKYLKNENDFFPWKVAFDCIGYMHMVLEDDIAKEKYISYIKNISMGITRVVDWKVPKTTNEKSLQILIMRKACNYNVTTKIKEASILFEKWMKDELDIRPSLFPLIWDCAISHGPQSFWDYNFQKYKDGGVYKDSLLMSLAATTRETTIELLLKYSLDKKLISSQDAPYLISQIAKNSKLGCRLSWEFIQENWDHIIRTYGNEVFLLSNMLQPVLENFSSERDLAQVETFFHAAKNAGSRQTVRQSINKIKLNIHWKEKHQSGLVDWLIEQGF